MKILSLVIFLVSFNSYSQVLWDWELKENIEENLTLNPVRYTNRAQCAADSNSPTKSAYVLIDTVNSGKSIYRMASMAGVDTNQAVKAGIEKVRYSISELIKLTSRKLLSGELPLLNSEIDNNIDDEIKSALNNCSKNQDCYDLNQIIGKIWNGDKESYKFNTNDYLNLNHKIGCYYIKQFSPIQGHLMQDRPSAISANALGEALSKASEYMVACEDIEKQENLKVTNYQIDITGISDSQWNRRGFDFWNSLKIYVSWAFRNSEEINALATPYQHIVKSINLEETMLLIPNGCKSITSPKCDATNLNLNNMREFAQMGDESEAFKSDVMNQIGAGYEEELVNTPIVDVNDDILNFAGYQTADNWAENFRNNYAKTRGFYRLKFLNALNKLKIIKANLSPAQLMAEIRKTKTEREKTLFKDSLYYMCSEMMVAGDETLSLLNIDLQVLNQDNVLDKLSRQLGGEPIKNYFSYYAEIKEKILPFCAELGKEDFWSYIEEESFDRAGFTSWYKEYTTEEKLPLKTNINRALSKEMRPIITLAPEGRRSRTNQTVCVEGANCARHILDAIIDMHSALKYADSMLVSDDIRAPHIANPYSERKACNIYDPFAKKRQTVYRFFYDIARAALFGFLPSPVYVDTDITPNRVVSLRGLMDEGKITYDPQYDERKMRQTLIADFGSLAGVPCAVSISNSTFNPVAYYRFNGISVSRCDERSENNMTVFSAGAMDNMSRNGSKCFTCAINLETVVGAASSIEPITRSAYILIRGVWNLFKGLRDPHNIPRAWEMNLDDVHHSYRKYGQVNKFCLRRLLKGRSCLGNTCERAITKFAGSHFKGGIEATYATRYRGDGFVKLNTCDEPIRVKLSGNRGRICRDGSMRMTENDFEIPAHCSVRKEDE